MGHRGSQERTPKMFGGSPGGFSGPEIPDLKYSVSLGPADLLAPNQDSSPEGGDMIKKSDSPN